MNYVYKRGTTLFEAERDIILSCLELHLGSRTHTANALDMSQRTLRYKLALYKKQEAQKESPSEPPDSTSDLL